MIDRTLWKEELLYRFNPDAAEGDVPSYWKDIVCDMIDALDQTGVDYSFIVMTEKRDGLHVELEYNASVSKREVEEILKIIEYARERVSSSSSPSFDN